MRRGPVRPGLPSGDPAWVRSVGPYCRTPRPHRRGDASPGRFGHLPPCRPHDQLSASEPSWPGRRLDAEEQVQIALCQVHVTAYRAGVAAPERRQHQAARVELDPCWKAVDLTGLVGQSLVAHRDPVVAGVAATDADADGERLGPGVPGYTHLPD